MERYPVSIPVFLDGRSCRTSYREIQEGFVRDAVESRHLHPRFRCRQPGEDLRVLRVD